MISTGIINITVPRKNTKPGNSNLSDAGYIELKIKAPGNYTSFSEMRWQKAVPLKVRVQHITITEGKQTQ